MIGLEDKLIFDVEFRHDLRSTHIHECQFTFSNLICGLVVTLKVKGEDGCAFLGISGLFLVGIAPLAIAKDKEGLDILHVATVLEL